MSKKEKLTCALRLMILIIIVVGIFTIMRPTTLKVAVLVSAIIFYIFIYIYINKDMKSIENYNTHGPIIEPYAYTNPVLASELSNIMNVKGLQDKYKISPSTDFFYSEPVQQFRVLNHNPSFVSKNQNLVGSANPKTFIPPINVAPIYEWNYWKTNDFQIPNTINTRSAQDFYQSGYYVDGCDSNLPPLREDIPPHLNSQGVYDTQLTGQGVYDKELARGVYDKELIRENYTEYNGISTGSKDKKKISHFPVVPGDTFGLVNKSCGYDTDNSEYNLPVNYDASESQKSQDEAGLNNQIFTSYVTDDIFYKNEIIEPLNYNAGISWTQQIPSRVKTSKNGLTVYDANNQARPVNENFSEFAGPDDVYDPRSNGYGTQDRMYIDELTGQPRFYYDDVNAIRQPNYISRSNIDHIKSVQTYGPVKSDQEIYKNNQHIRGIAEKDFNDSSLQFREDMMVRLMRKTNAEAWQNKLAPKSRSAVYTMGGMALH